MKPIVPITSALLNQIHHELINYIHTLKEVPERSGYLQVGAKAYSVARYIPELAKVSAKQLAIAVVSANGELMQAGCASQAFSIQSIVKVFALALALERNESTEIWQRVKREPSGNAFNSLVQLEYEQGIPRNPFINAGAIVVTDILCSQFALPESALLNFIRKLAQTQSIEFNDKVAQSELTEAHRNFAIAHLIKSFQNLNNAADDVVKTYCKHCSIEMSCIELAKAGLFLANHQLSNLAAQANLFGNCNLAQITKRINAIMLTCGAYDASGDLAYRIGWPLKTGVGGGILAIIPNQYSIAVWSPLLNEYGNSYLGTLFLEKLSQATQLSIL